MWLLNFNYSFHGQLTVHSCKCIICSNGYYDTTCSISEESSFQWQGISIIFENFPHPSQSFSYSILCCRIADRLLYSTESLFLRGFYTAQEITHILYGLFTALLRGHFDFLMAMQIGRIIFCEKQLPFELKGFIWPIELL